MAETRDNGHVYDKLLKKKKTQAANLDLHLISTRIQVGHIGPHSDAILICLDLPPPLPPR